MGKYNEFENLKLQIPEPAIKYRKGEKTDDFHEIKNIYPVFAFDYISMQKSDFCFNGRLLGTKDYAKLLQALKSISGFTYQQMNDEYRFHFHEVEWEEVSVSASDFYKCVNGKYDGEEDITPYQFKVFEEARIIGFIYRGIFHLVMFDRGHNAYKRKDNKKR